VEFVFDQALPTWIQLHGRAFTFFGGVPHRVVLDHLQAGIVKAGFGDPQVQSTYRECAEHDGFLLAPCRPRTPEHKGKVEQGGVHDGKRHCLGGRVPTRLSQANEDGRQWCLTPAGQRRQGTTQELPLDRFEAVARTQLKPLPIMPYDLAVWKRVRLHRDCDVVFAQAFYPAPFRLVGQPRWVRGGSQEVRRSTTRDELVATHPPSINRQQVLHLASGESLRQKRHVLICGPTGVGKSHLAQALAPEACRRGFGVLFVNTHKMLQHLHRGRADGTWTKRLSGYRRLELLALDDFGLKPLVDPAPSDLYDVINARDEVGRILVPSNRAPAEWPELFGNPLLASGPHCR
jgi:hypothetical protein